MPPSDTPRRLGRGLGALLNPTPMAVPAAGAAATSVAVEGVQEGVREVVQHLLIAGIRPNPFQPRKQFRPEELAELVASIKTSGLLQPVTVRRVAAAGRSGDRYELLAGERRLRAARELGWTEIPAIVRDVDDRTALTLALIENLQRSDLNPIEEAEGYARLVREFSLTQQHVAELVGKDRSTVANTLRLLNLPVSVQDQVRSGALTLGHARALLSLGSEQEIVAAAVQTVSRGLTVRELEGVARAIQAPIKRRPRATKASKRLDAHGKEVEDRLRRYLQTDVRLSLTARDRGQVSILFYSNDDLERILELILGRNGERL